MSFLSKKTVSDDTWMSVSDMMAGLMMVFMLIIVFYTQTVEEKVQVVNELVSDSYDIEASIYRDLKQEFRGDLAKWDAEIDRETLTIRFISPKILFAEGSAKLRPDFIEILDDFMPRYIRLLHSGYKDKIDEIRIEGHTSSDWFGLSENESFIKNMELSQGRTRNVLGYTMNIKRLEDLNDWMTKKLSANGLSSAKLVFNKEGKEDKERSRRVEFTIKTKAKDRIFRTLREKNLISLEDKI